MDSEAGQSFISAWAWPGFRLLGCAFLIGHTLVQARIIYSEKVKNNNNNNIDMWYKNISMNQDLKSKPSGEDPYRAGQDPTRKDQLKPINPLL